MSSSPITVESSKNPFFAAFATPSRPVFGDEADDGAVSATAPEGSYVYAMMPSAPAVDATEVESAKDAMEVTVKWGNSVLYVTHLSPVRDFTVGEAACDFTMSAEKLGAEKTSLSLGNEKRVTKEIGGLTFELTRVNAGRKVAGRGQTNKRALGFGLLAGLLHAGVFAAMYCFTPALNATDDSAMNTDQQAKLTEMLSAMAEKEQNETQAATKEDKASQESGNDGKRAKDAEGKAGSLTETRTNGAFAVKKTSDGAPMLSRTEAIQDARDFGMIGLLSTSRHTDADSVKSPWGDIANGNDPLNADGNMWGDTLGNSSGEGGLGLAGPGQGGGGFSDLIGLGEIGTIGHNHGNCAGGPCSGSGVGPGFLPGTHHVGSQSMRPGITTASGRLPPEVIQRVIRQNFGRFRACYESGLRGNPNLAGRVAVNFIIGVDGSVGSVSAGGDLPDKGVISCVARAFGSLSFPAPDGGIVTVGYPISFNPQ